MKVSWQLFGGLALFYAIVTVIYWQVGGESVGIGGMGLAAALAAMVGFYLWHTQKRIGVILPEDNESAEIADGAGELGFYSPHSWQPLVLGFFATLFGLGLIIGWWLTLIGVVGLLISIIGFVTEYEKPIKTSH